MRTREESGHREAGEILRILDGMAAGREHIARLRAGLEPPLTPDLCSRLRELFGRELTPQEAVAQIIADVRQRGDAALREYTRRIDGVALDTFIADAAAIEAAYQATPADLRDVLHLAAERIRAFHEREPRHSWLEWARRAVPWANCSVRCVGWASTCPAAAPPIPRRS